MNVPIPHSKPTLSSKDLNAVLNVLRSGQLTQGEKVKQFERSFAEYHQSKYTAATHSGTAALHLALLALNVGKGDEVIIPSFVCTALLNAVNYTGARARIADINPEDFNISPISARKLLNKKTKAIIAPHMFGCPCDLKPLLSLGIPIIEDCAQSLGAIYAGQKVGTWGVLSVFSFYATKVITTGEGGMVMGNNMRLIDKIIDLRDYDNKKDYRTRFNYKMTEFQAALGLTQLKQLPRILQKRKSIACFYKHSLNQKNMKHPDIYQDIKSPIYYRYVLRAKKNQRKILTYLRQKGIQAEIPVYKPLHHYLKTGLCPETDLAMKQSVSIPIYPTLIKTQSEKIISCLKNITE